MRTIRGWGTVNSEAELFARIDEEIGRQERQADQYRRDDVDAVAWMVGDGYSEAQILETLGISRKTLRRITRLLECEIESEEE